MRYELKAPRRQVHKELTVFREMARLPRLLLQRRSLPRGRGRVLVVPGFMTGDGITWPLRRFLTGLGYEVDGWGMGINRGDVAELLPRLTERTQTMARESQEPIHLVGWSLGGYLAREVARDAPEAVAQVITMASPVVGGPKYTASSAWYRRRGIDLDAIEAEVAAREEVPLRIPVTALYSPVDAIVCPGACIDRHNSVEHIPVDTSHGGFGFSPVVYRIVADRLARRPTLRT